MLRRTLLKLKELQSVLSKKTHERKKKGRHLVAPPSLLLLPAAGR